MLAKEPCLVWERGCLFLFFIKVTIHADLVLEVIIKWTLLMQNIVII